MDEAYLFTEKYASDTTKDNWFYGERNLALQALRLLPRLQRRHRERSLRRHHGHRVSRRKNDEGTDGARVLHVCERVCQKEKC